MSKKNRLSISKPRARLPWWSRRTSRCFSCPRTRRSLQPAHHSAGAFEIDPATIPGRALGELGNGEWAMPRLASLLKATASGSARIEAYEIDLKRPDRKTRQLIVNAQVLDDGNKDHIRLPGGHHRRD